MGGPLSTRIRNAVHVEGEERSGWGEETWMTQCTFGNEGVIGRQSTWRPESRLGVNHDKEMRGRRANSETTRWTPVQRRRGKQAPLNYIMHF